MIDKDVYIVDIDPYTWRNLGVMLNLGNEAKRSFYVLCDDEGEIINAYDTKNGVTLIEGSVQDPRLYAENLIKQNPEIHRVFVFKKSALVEFNKQMQKHAYEDMDVDEYIEYAVQQFNSIEGIYVYPAIDIPPVIKLLKRHVENMADNTYSTVCIFDGEDLYFSIIVGKRYGKVNFISTMDHLDNMGVKNVKWKDKEKVLSAMKDAFNEDVSVKFITLYDLRAKISSMK